MPAVATLAGMEIAGGGTVDVCWDRRRRGRSNRRRQIPIEFHSQAAFNDYITNLSFTPSGDYSPVHFGSLGLVNPYNHTLRESVSEEVDLESGELEAKVHSCESEQKQCRICHLKYEGCADEDDDDDDEVAEGNGGAIELGCDCKGDLATAHEKCALTWFLMKGDFLILDFSFDIIRKCEICGSIVRNVGGLAQNVDFEQIEAVNNDGDEVHQPPDPESSMAEPFSELENGSSISMHGRRFVNVVLGCMAFAFVISWLVHFNMLH
ncbi:hypothetical protein LXL04_036381 [Taraxacum kok-saghyz]